MRDRPEAQSPTRRPSFLSMVHLSSQATIDGEMLVDLSDADLQRELGITSKLHRRKILKKLDHFKKQ